MAAKSSRWNISRRSFLKGVVISGTVLAAQPGFKASKARANESSAPLGPGEEYAYTYCDACNHVPKCGIKAVLKDGKVIRLERRENYPNSPLCAKGVATIQELYDPERLLYPVKRTNPKGSADPGWQRISWDEAYDLIVKNLNDIKHKYGAEKVMFYCGDPKEPRPAMQRLAYTFGSPNYGNESSTCAWAPRLAALLTYGVATTGSSPTEKTKLCIIWSKNPAWSEPHLFGKLLAAKERGTKFIVVDPRVTPTVEHIGDLHLQLRPGTDGALALGMMHVLINEGLYDQEFVEKWVHGFAELKEYVREFTPEKTAEITGVPADKIRQAVRMFGTHKPATWVGSASPTTHSSNATQNHRGILAFMALTGNLDVEGGISFPTNPLPFDMFAGHAQFNRLTDLHPQIVDKRVDKDRAPVWAHYFPEIQTNFIPEYVKEGKIRAIVMCGGNALMWPQPQEYQQALQNMDFGVAADYYLRPWTHNYMDVVLPAAMPYERMAALAVFGRRVFLREPIIEPLGEAKPDWQWIMELGARLVGPEEFFHGSEEAAVNEVLQLATGKSIDEFKGKPEGVFIAPPGPDKFKKYELGLLRKDGQPGFPTKTGKIEIYSTVLEEFGFDPLPTYQEPVESPISTPELAKQYPLVLNTGSRVPMYTHSKLRDIPWLRNLMPVPIVRINPKDAQARGIQDGDKVVVSSPHGRITMFAEVTNIVLPGAVDIFHGWEQADCNELVPRYFDPISCFPPYKEGLCQVAKA